ncbi:MAG: 5-formyltetrahydrofolate cyclo-ligase [Gammaproteobacteria bacterium]|jgi:5-formyltetrahydrofolate cyclo-ligase
MIDIRQQLRQTAKAKRAALSAVERQEKSVKIAQHIINSDLFKSSQHIACYMAKGAEVNLQEVIENILSTQMPSSRGLTAGSKKYRNLALDPAVKPRDDNDSIKHCYLPLIRQGKSELYFIEYLTGDDLQVGSFKILEPKFDKQKLITPEDLDLVLMPLAAFDMHGNRLGMGGGYYDRTFARTSHPMLIGVAYTCQEVPQIAAEPWDVKLHGVVTEEGFKIF